MVQPGAKFDPRLPAQLFSFMEEGGVRGDSGGKSSFQGGKSAHAQMENKFVTLCMKLEHYLKFIRQYFQHRNAYDCDIS